MAKKKVKAAPEKKKEAAAAPEKKDKVDTGVTAPAKAAVAKTPAAPADPAPAALDTGPAAVAKIKNGSAIKVQPVKGYMFEPFEHVKIEVGAVTPVKATSWILSQIGARLLRVVK